MQSLKGCQLNTLVSQFPDGPLVLDASALINLLGCGNPGLVLAALGVRCLIEQRTLAEITRHPVGDISREATLDALLSDGLLYPCRMTSEEYDIYLSLVSGRPSDVLGDGESAAIATACGTGHALILDDRKARRICGARFPGIPVASSLGLFIEAGNRAGWSIVQVRDLVHTAREMARMNVVRGEEPLLAALGL